MSPLWRLKWRSSGLIGVAAMPSRRSADARDAMRPLRLVVDGEGKTCLQMRLLKNDEPWISAAVVLYTRLFRCVSTANVEPSVCCVVDFISRQKYFLSHCSSSRWQLAVVCCSVQISAVRNEPARRNRARDRARYHCDELAVDRRKQVLPTYRRRSRVVIYHFLNVHLVERSLQKGFDDMPKQNFLSPESETKFQMKVPLFSEIPEISFQHSVG